MIDLSNNHEQIYQLLKQAEDLGLGYLKADPDINTGRTVSIGGKQRLNFANCSYLGLDTDPRVKQGAIDAITKYGIMMANSRAYFSSYLYSELKELMQMILPGHLSITPTTTLAHYSNLPVLIQPDDLIIADIHAHNSVQTTAKICVAAGTKMIYLRRHNDMEYLEKMISKPEYEGKTIWFLGDGLYSMQGEFVDLAGLKKLLSRHPNVYAYLDDAHGFGWTGEHGAGFVMGERTLHPQIIAVASMWKSFGAYGGITSFPDENLGTRLRHIGATQIFSAPLPSSSLGAAIASAKIHLSGEITQYQNELREKITYFKTKCGDYTIPLKTKAVSPIQFIQIGTNKEVYDVNIALFKRGIYCTSAVYPAMPKKRGGMRISISRHLEYKDIDYLLENLADVLNNKTGSGN